MGFKHMNTGPQMQAKMDRRCDRFPASGVYLLSWLGDGVCDELR